MINEIITPCYININFKIIIQNLNFNKYKFWIISYDFEIGKL